MVAAWMQDRWRKLAKTDRDRAIERVVNKDVSYRFVIDMTQLK